MKRIAIILLCALAVLSSCSKSEDDKTVRIATKPMTEQYILGEMLGLQKGEANGLQRGRQEVARSMVQDGSIPIPKIAEFSGLTIGEVESIRNSLR